ncbi:glutaredoxin-1 [Saitoella complicata NRRL Y-17804]|nr:glutaredoxin-1 [Saitoella complicata NRRL Y-17804]ODQ56544.1 glutaredoxin-1 [Saitoella complicata NRRL Y-17804]
MGAAFSQSSPRIMSPAVKSKVDKAIADNKIAVFSKSYCPYCKQAKNTLSQLGIKFYVLELDEVDDGAQIQDYLQEKTGQRTVPNIFINGQHLGGNSDLQTKKSTGELEKLLA